MENSNTSSAADYNRNVTPKKGKVEAFTAEENRAMSIILRRIMNDNGWTGALAGSRLGVNQQNASKLKNNRQGFGRQTALKLAEIAGYASPEDMLKDHGVNPAVAPVGWAMRDLAVGLARRAGYSEAAIAAVVARFSKSEFAHRPAKWWMDRIVMEDQQLAAEASVEAPASRTVVDEEPQPAKPKRRRKTA